MLGNNAITVKYERTLNNFWINAIIRVVITVYTVYMYIVQLHTIYRPNLFCGSNKYFFAVSLQYTGLCTVGEWSLYREK